jgi:hypothetical protein
MSRDHFVAQTCLRHWSDPTTQKLNAYRKDGGEPFLCATRDVCFEWDGDANPRFKNPRLLGEFRKIFEPGWNPTIGAIRNGALSATDKFMLAGLWAQLTTFTPAWQRNAVKVYEHNLGSVLPIVAQRVAAKHPESKEYLEQAIAEGRICPTVDPDFVKQVLTQQLTNFTIALYEQDWTIIENPTDVRFITSDNPSSVFPDRPLAAPLVRLTSPLISRTCTSRRRTGTSPAQASSSGRSGLSDDTALRKRPGAVVWVVPAMAGRGWAAHVEARGLPRGFEFPNLAALDGYLHNKSAHFRRTFALSH